MSRIKHYREYWNTNRKRLPSPHLWHGDNKELTVCLAVSAPLFLIVTAPLIVTPIASAASQQKAGGASSSAPPTTPPPAYLTTLKMQVAPNNDNGPLAPVPPPAPGEEVTSTTPEIIALGKRLFFDPILSGSNKQSCASCHQPDHGYADTRRLSVGDDGKTVSRNTPSLTNIAYSSLLFWDGRTNRLEEQALLPIQNPAEMNQKLPDLLVELIASGYEKDFAQAFGGVGNTALTETTLARALAAYERTLTLTDTRYDRWMRGDKEALSYDALRGLLVFTSDKAGCVRCHSGPSFTRAAPSRSDAFVRLGLLPIPGDPKDLGRAAVAGTPGQPLRMSELFARAGAFRIPALRGVSQTAPYMHNGSLPTLEAVVDFYDRGGDENLLRPLGLTPDEKRHLVVFLREGLSHQTP